MALSLESTAGGESDDLAVWEAAYRKRLTRPAVVDRLEWEPVKIGPTWQRDGAGWLLPERTLGWRLGGRWCLRAAWARRSSTP